MNQWPERPRALISYAYIKPDEPLPAYRAGSPYPTRSTQ